MFKELLEQCKGGYHEPQEKLTEKTQNFHRAIISLIEELEAVDWYHQRWERTTDKQLKEIVKHNRDEEIEHAAMTLEWLRRNDDVFDKILKEYLFKTNDIVEH